MTKTSYRRPAGTNATAVGEKNRTRWSRHLRSTIFDVIKPVEFLAAEEGSALTHRRYPTADRPRWVSTRIRIDQMAAIELLQARHLEATGKEISRAEVLAALMAAGLGTIINHHDFKVSTSDATAL